MSQARHSRIAEIFLRACELAPSERPALLERECGADVELRREVEAMLATEEQLPGFLESPAAPPGEHALPGEGANFTVEILERLSGRERSHSRYESRGEVARGGQGAILRVWDQDLRRDLAMKVSLGMDQRSGSSQGSDPRTLGRFLEEAQVTGQLDHPGIVPVHELGLDAEGRCYFTMKLVKGKDLGQVFELVRARQEGWTQTRALNVLLKVCEALAYAHSKDVIHRDLKPSNIMVGRYGEVYVMDWGLARVLGQKDRKDIRLRPASPPPASVVRTERHAEPADSPLVTMDGDIVGTPAYMSPEQGRGDLAAMGPASDVYSLGAILYHLLAGHMPYAPSGSRLNAYAIWGLLQNGPPTPIDDLARAAPEELIAICEKAMRRDSGERYTDTRAMGEDLSAYLEGRVVRAHRTGAWVELVKWTRRNRALAGALAAAFVALAAGLVASIALGRRAEANARLAEVRRGESEASRRFAEQQSYLANVYAAGAARERSQIAKARRRLEAAPEALRGFEWHYLANNLDQSIATLGGRESLPETLAAPAPEETDDSISFVAFSPDGARIASGGRSPTTRIWSATSGAEIAELPGRPSAFSPDWSRFVALSRDGPPRVRDTTTGSELCALGEAPLWLALFSPDGSLVATGSDSGNLVLWDAETGALVASLAGHTDQITSLAFSPDGQYLATGSSDTTNRLWGLASRTTIATFQVEVEWPIAGMAFSPDGSILATTSAGGVVRLWNAHSAEPIARLGTHSAPASAVAFSPDGARVFSGSDDATLKVWDVETARELATLTGHKNSVLALALSPDGALVASGSLDGEVRLWDATSLLDGLALRDCAGHAVGGLALSPDGSRLASLLPDGSIGLWDTSSGARIQAFEGRALTETLGNHLAFSPDGVRLACASGGETLDFWSIATGERLRSWRDPGETLHTVAFSRDGALVASGSGAGLVRIRVASGGKEVLRFAAHESPVTCIAFSPDASRLAAGDATGVIRLWDTANGEALMTGPKSWSAVLALVFSPDGSWLASGQWSESALRIRDGRTGELLEVLEGHSNMVHTLAFSLDGSRLVSGSADRKLRIWETAPWEELLTLTGHDEWVLAAAFTPDGSRIVSTSQDGRLRWWDGEPTPSMQR